MRGTYKQRLLDDPALTPRSPQHAHALQAYEGQVSSLARALARLEEDLKGAQGEKAALLSDLASVRELCVKLDSGKELTARHLTSKSMELERVGGADKTALLPLKHSSSFHLARL